LNGVNEMFVCMFPCNKIVYSLSESKMVSGDKYCVLEQGKNIFRLLHSLK